MVDVTELMYACCVENKVENKFQPAEVAYDLIAKVSPPVS